MKTRLKIVLTVAFAIVLGIIFLCAINFGLALGLSRITGMEVEDWFGVLAFLPLAIMVTRYIITGK